MTNRVAALLLVVACIGALIFADEQNTRDASSDEGVGVVIPMPVSSSADSLGSTWYCPGAIVAGPAGDADQVSNTLVVTNPGDDVIGVLTVFPAIPDGAGSSVAGDPFETTISVDSSTQEYVDLGEIINQRSVQPAAAGEIYGGVLLEFAAPGVVVEHRQRTSFGVDAGPCASQPSNEWFFASGTTTSGVRELVAVLNPFQTNAVLDITFVHDEGLRAPGAYDKMVVPARSLIVLDVGLENTVRAQSAMSVVARSGRVIVERMQQFGNDNGPRGFSTALGATQPAIQWFFPSGRSIPGAGESYVIFNPNETEADVELLLRLDQASEGSESRPFPLVVGANERIVVTIDETDTHPSADLGTSFGDRIPADATYWLSVQSFNDVPIVVDRVVTVDGTTTPGVLMSPGAPLASQEQWLSLPFEFGASSPQVAVVNPANDTIARLKVSAIVGEEMVLVTEVEIGAGERIAADLSASLPVGAVALFLEASTPVVAEVTVATGFGAVSSLGIPAADSVAPPRLIISYQ